MISALSTNIGFKEEVYANSPCGVTTSALLCLRLPHCVQTEAFITFAEGQRGHSVSINCSSVKYEGGTGGSLHKNALICSPHLSRSQILWTGSRQRAGSSVLFLLGAHHIQNKTMISQFRLSVQIYSGGNKFTSVSYLS